MFKRSDLLNSIRENPDVDVLVIGGGVNGIGTFRDLALQGVKVLLAEKSDFSAGASAASSHMLHGGIRYLENGEFRLVREALHERNLMLKNAPHYAHPLPTTIPIFRWFSGMFNAPLKFLRLRDKSGERGAAVIKMGLIMYDAFTGPQQSMPFHDVVMKRESLRRFPKLNPDVVCTATYYDAWMPYPERICLEMILDAEMSNPNAIAVNYLSATGGDGDTVTLTDELTGNPVMVKPKTVINAAGPWIDFVNRALDHSTRFIGGTKGSHLIVDHAELLDALRGSEMFFENDDGRIVLILPYLDRVMIGTTDIRIDDPDQAITTEDEIDYILDMVDKVFPSITVDRSHIVYQFCGVRPLPASETGSTGTISRDHSIKTIEPGKDLNFRVHSLVGGKWTSFRAFSEEAADVALSDIGKQRQVTTTDIPIGGGKLYPQNDHEREAWLRSVQQSTELERSHLNMLFERYGTYARKVARYISAGDDAPLEHLPAYTRREVMFIVEHEKVQRLDDVLMRRTLMAMQGYVTLSPALIDEVAAIVADMLGWDGKRQQEEVERVKQMMVERHGWTAETAST